MQQHPRRRVAVHRCVVVAAPGTAHEKIAETGVEASSHLVTVEVLMLKRLAGEDSFGVVEFQAALRIQKNGWL